MGMEVGQCGVGAAGRTLSGREVHLTYSLAVQTAQPPTSQ